MIRKKMRMSILLFCFFLGAGLFSCSGLVHSATMDEVTPVENAPAAEKTTAAIEEPAPTAQPEDQPPPFLYKPKELKCTRSTLEGIKQIVEKAGGTIAAQAAILTEGDQERWSHIVSLGHLPLFTSGSD